MKRNRTDERVIGNAENPQTCSAQAGSQVPGLGRLQIKILWSTVTYNSDLEAGGIRDRCRLRHSARASAS
jgi:hypothetical protein